MVQMYITEYDEWNDVVETRRPLSTGIFSAIKNVTIQPGFEPMTSCLAGRRTTNCATVTILSFY